MSLYSGTTSTTLTVRRAQTRVYVVYVTCTSTDHSADSCLAAVARRTPSRHSDNGKKDHSHSDAGHNGDDGGCHGDLAGIHGYHSSDPCLVHDSDGRSIEAGYTWTTLHVMAVVPSLLRNMNGDHYDRGSAHHTAQAAHCDGHHHG